MVPGIIVAAVGDERVLVHPTGHADRATVATVVGNTALILFGHLLLNRTAFGMRSISRLVALPVLGVLALIGQDLFPILLSALPAAVIVGVIVFDGKAIRDETDVPGGVVSH